MHQNLKANPAGFPGELLWIPGCLPWEFPWQTAGVQQEITNEFVKCLQRYTHWGFYYVTV